jgi:hypothetical protein
MPASSRLNSFLNFFDNSENFEISEIKMIVRDGNWKFSEKTSAGEIVFFDFHIIILY